MSLNKRNPPKAWNVYFKDGHYRLYHVAGPPEGERLYRESEVSRAVNASLDRIDEQIAYTDESDGIAAGVIARLRSEYPNEPK